MPAEMRKMAGRLGGVIRPGDVIARVNGHRFGLLAIDVREYGAALSLAQGAYAAFHERSYELGRVDPLVH